jgi:uncharacterized protein
MSRIGKAYVARFRALLLRIRARKLEQGVDWLTNRARQTSTLNGITLNEALAERCERLRGQVARWEVRAHGIRPFSIESAPRFLCDAGLGGLARWLRAAGYETFWFADIDDPALLQQARQLDATILTSDSLMMERRVLRDGLLCSIWLPPTLTKGEQLALVFRELGLAPRPPRCMRCGGELRRVDKESVRERIPPKTWRWIDDYFLCAQCGQLFWHGTHWQRITAELSRRLAPLTGPIRGR